MKKRLIKVATELNVGTATIVEFLNKKGFEIDNKPTAKVTPEMMDALQEEYRGSLKVKERADQIVIGTRPTPGADKQDSKGGKPADDKSDEAPKDSVVERPTLSGTKVLGKIDLSKRLRGFKKPEADTPAEQPAEEPAKAKAEPEAQPAQEEPAQPAQPAEPGEAKVTEPAAEQPEPEPAKAATPEPEEPAAKKPAETKAAEPEAAPAEAEAKAETEAKPEAEAEAPAEEKTAEETAAAKAAEQEAEQKKAGSTIKAAAPELRGLKILGKIELKKPERKKKGEKDDNKKRRRRRKKVATDNTANRTANRRGRTDRGSRDEVREVSQKEIEEKMKATLARIQGGGGGKKKRQRQRRENRERIRERQDMLEQENKTDKLQVTEFISVSELASLMDVDPTDVIMTCMNAGVIVSINQRLDAEIIELVASEFDHEVEFISADADSDEEDIFDDDPEDLEPRPPIVTVMGHVDHGKTSLLDYIREANVVAGEAGGITQHVGAYEVTLENGKQITFLDTPGHEAFTAMRARGAKVTDIAIIIIAADDNIMPQTKEAISHAEAAGVPIVFAINKVDKDNANPDRIKQELASMNYLIEEWGGKYQSHDISAKTGLGIPELLEKVVLEAEILELKANPDREAVGAVLEASLEKGRGYVAKSLIQTGTLEVGDVIVAGEYSGRVKAMFNERNKRVKKAGPSTPVLVLGLDGAPQAGEMLKVMESEQEARQLAARRAQIAREQATRANKRISLDEIGRRLALGNFKELNLIVKGDVDGSIEALSDSLIKLSQETVQVNVIHKAVGQIIESDVLLASASDAIIIGFQVRPSSGARKLAEREGVEIKMYSIIYEAIEEIKAAIEGMLEPTKEERIVANVAVRETFKISKVGTIAGCYVEEGKITRSTPVRIIRDGIVIYPTKEGVTAEIDSLKRFKDDVKEVRAGMECGISIENYNDIKVGDIIEGYEIIEIKQKLEL
jgi:translation initiation factor IF-2